METWPNIYAPWETYIPCDPHFADLSQVVERVLNNYGEYIQIVIKAHEVMSNAWNNNVFAKRFDDIMKTLV